MVSLINFQLIDEGDLNGEEKYMNVGLQSVDIYKFWGSFDLPPYIKRKAIAAHLTLIHLY